MAIPQTDILARDTVRRRRPRGLQAPLGMFQYLIMRSIERLGGNAYGARIEEYITEQLRVPVDLAQVYVSVRRIAELGYLTFKEVELPGGGGRTVKVYRASEDGQCALKESAAIFAALAKLQQGENPNEHQMPRATATSKRSRPRGESNTKAR